MVFDVDWKVWVFIVVFHSLPINKEGKTGAPTTPTWKVNNEKHSNAFLFSSNTITEVWNNTFWLRSVRQGKYTSRQRTSASVCVLSQKCKKFDNKNESVWQNSSKGFIENGLNNQGLHPRHMNFCGIQRDVDEILISGLFSLGFFPTCPRGPAPGWA